MNLNSVLDLERVPALSRRVWWLTVLCLAFWGCGSKHSSSSTQAPPIVYACDGTTTGLTQPLPVCSGAQPCNHAIVFGNGGFSYQTVNTASNAPACKTSNGLINDGPPMTWTDPDGVRRYSCLFKPSGASPASNRPLLIFFHGSGGHASDAYNYTGIRVKAIDYDLTGDTNRPGFILASVQGRNLHWPTTDSPGRHHDYYYRDMGSPSTNPDVANVDHLIDTLVGQGIVDPARIYVMGWSNGATFAQFYAMARFQTKTPGQNNVAAAAVYAFANPFANISWTQTPSCELNTYPTSAVPLYLANRTFDALTACDADQETLFGLPPGHSAVDWFGQLQNSAVVNDSAVQIQLINLQTTAASACDPAHPPPPTADDFITGTDAHLRWPNGKLDGTGGDDWEVPMLEYLKANPHS